MEFNTNLKGLNLDVNELQNEGLLYSFSLNATIENFSEPQPEPYRSNMASNVYCFKPDVDDKVVGHLYIPEFERTILFTYNHATKESKFIDVEVLKKDPYTTDYINSCGAKNVSYIITTPQCTSRIIASSTCFDWSTSPKFIYKITDCSLNLYFINGVDEDRLISLDFDSQYNLSLNKDFKISNNDDCDPVYFEQIDCSKTKWNPDVLYPCIELSEIPGEKEKGTYQYLAAYSTYSGVLLSNFKSLTQTFNLKEPAGIKINISNVTKDSRYKFITIVCVETVKGVTTYHKKETIPVSQSSFIDTKNGGANISLSNLLSQYPFYKSSNDFTESNNILFKADVSEYEKFNLQPVINLVELEWVTIVAKEGDYSDPEFANKYKSVLRDEVYSYAIVPILDNGELGPYFPLIGRQALLSDRATVDSISYSCNTVPTERWQVENTAPAPYFTSSTSLSQLSQNCDNKEIYQAGEFSFWESTERYPNNPVVWGELCGELVRHFKFPDTKVSPHQSNNSSYEQGNYIFPMGIRIKSDMNVIFNLAVTQGLITQEQRNRIKGYKVLRGDREGNKSIVAKGLLYDVWSYKRQAEKDDNFLNDCVDNERTYYYPNYPYNDLNDDVYLSGQNKHYDMIHKNGQLQPGLPLLIPRLKYDNNKTRFTFHSPETHFNKPKLGNLIKYEAEVSGKAKGFFNKSEDFAKYRLLSEKHYSLAKAYASFISSSTQSPTEEALAAIGSQAVGTVAGAGGSALGALVGIPGLGAVTGAIGSFVGGMIGTKIGSNTFSTSLYKNSSYLLSFEKMLNLLKQLNKGQDYNYQHQSVGKYNEISNINIPRRDFPLLEKEYLSEGKQTVKDGNSSILFNNKDRESSVYLKSSLYRPDYTKVDNSRILLSQNTTASSILAQSSVDEKGKTFKVSSEEGVFRIYVLRCDGAYGVWPFLVKKGESTVIPCAIEITPVQVTAIGHFEKPEITGEVYIEVLPDDPDFPCLPCTGTYYKQYPCSCNNPTERNISSFYVSNKIYSPNQYGSIYDINYLETKSCASDFSSDPESKIFFGGDTYISRMSLKRKHNFFLRNTHKLPEDTDFNYSLVPNVANPIYFFNTVSTPEYTIMNMVGLSFPLTGFGDFEKQNLLKLFALGLFNKNNIQPPYYKLDCYNNINDVNPYPFPNSSLFQSKPLQGLIYSYVYGIPYFITESSINLDLRDDDKEASDRFYPKESNLDSWLQESTNPIKLDNTYYYDTSFSKQVTESFNFMYDINFKGLQDCKTEHPQRVIYSGQSQNIDDNNYSDPYLINKALDLHDFSKEGGKLISIDGIEGDRVLVRQENTSYVYSSVIQLNTDVNTVLLSTGSIFSNKPLQYSGATNGYTGSQHKAMLHTPFGHLFVDAKRGNIFLLGNGGQGLEEISNKGLRHWFKENLPFKIKSQFNDIDVDDNFNGVGLLLSFDKKFNQVFITKLDYESKNEDIRYNDFSKLFYLESTGDIISLEDKKYFKNKCWTISYSFYRQEWVSFHSFTPLYYVDQIDTFLSGNKDGAWQHNITNKSYQVFYNKVEPFIVETTNKGGLNYNIVKSVSYYADFIRYHNDFDYYYNLEQRFNKAIVYGKSANSGMLYLEPQSNSYKERLSYPKVGPDYTKIEETIKEQAHSFNQFKNKIKPDYTYSPHWMLDSNNVNKRLNFQAFIFSNSLSNDYIRDANIKVRLIQDIETRYKIIFKGITLDMDNSTR